jgi:hypothetical protein
MAYLCFTQQGHSLIAGGEVDDLQQTKSSDSSTRVVTS